MSAPLKLICLRTNAPQFDPSKGEAGLPQRILVLPWGENDTTKGKVICNETTLAQLEAFNASKGWDRPYFDYEHNTIPESPTYKGEPCEIAGHAERLELTAGVGIHYIMPALSNWTDSGKKLVPTGNYPDLSPVVAVNDKDEVIGLHSAAFCRHGATPGLVFLSATAPGHNAATPPSTTHPATPKTMKPEDFQKALAKALGLPDAASAEDILAALTAKLETKDAKDDAAMSGDMKQLSAGIGEIKLLLKKQGETIQAQDERIKLLSSGVDSNEVATILREAAGAGKQVPAWAAKNLKAPELKLLCAELPVTVPVNLRTPDAQTMLLSSSATVPAVNAELAAIDKLTGISDEDAKKYAVQ